MTTTGQAQSQPHTNRLARATSPYLLQHAQNPVDWYEWGPEALERARREDKPIFLSIGYSACHWCHVMAHESFESAEIAGVMNRLFVNVKVDREERPDLDDIYMQATMLFNRGQGGWPMSVWLTPDLKPFLAATYFPPEPRFGRPGFRDVCERIGEAWAARRDDVVRSAEQAARLLAENTTATSPTPAVDAADGGPGVDLELLDRTALLYVRVFDDQRGGMSGGGPNKFPPSMALDLMLRYVARTAGPQRRLAESDAPHAGDARRILGLATLTLDRMADGGIFDQLGGGIHRYSTDPDWLVPHFEKMLYDQALVARAYLDSWQYTANPRYAQVAASIFDYVLGDLQSPDGGFYSTRDADSEGDEGRYYVWTRDEFVSVLGDDDARLLCDYYDVSDAGNWSDPHAPGQVKNILHAPHDLETVAKLRGVAPDELRRKLDAAKRSLLNARGRRVAPHRDEKVLAEWNGMMISALARGGAALDQPRYVQAAARAAEFVWSRQWRGGRLLRSYRDGRTLETAFLTDYACMIDGLIELYEATFDRRWLDRAVQLDDVLTRQFWDQERGGYYFSAHDHEPLILRPKDIRDGATPSGNSVQLMNLLRLAVMFDDPACRNRAERMIRLFGPGVAAAPGSSDRFLAGVEFALAGPVEVAVVGDSDDIRTRDLLRAVRETYLPNRVVMLHDPRRPADSVDSPLLRGRECVGGQPTAYVCRGYACRAPVTTAAALRAQLGAD